ncbi:MAG: hypothetical protein IT538_04245 [Variibacter sp.]|nr:hypothetical protein [Variibacter sp.]
MGRVLSGWGTLCWLALACATGSAQAQSGDPLPIQPPAAVQSVPADGDLRIDWEVKNRFRLFRHESDFQRHLAADRGDGVLGAERRLAEGSGGHGWARLMLNGLCVDAAGNLVETCERDGVRESYLAPTDYRIGMVLRGAPAGARCAWKVESADTQPRTVEVPCQEEVRLRVQALQPTVASADVTFPDGSVRRATAEILVRDLLIAGIGDSIASGDGNPDRAIALDDEGFCFRRVAGGAGSSYFRPGRAGFRGNKACDNTTPDARTSDEWSRHGASWMSAACHRSLYGYQLRAALALAIESRQVAVTFVPLACSGASIEKGLLAARPAREIACGGRGRRGRCPTTVPGQLMQMQTVLAQVRRRQPARQFDAVLLTVGANDIYFSELVADAILLPSGERTLVRQGGGIASIEDAREALKTGLPSGFTRLRAALKPMVGGDLGRVLFVSYGNPATHDGGAPCNGGRDGFDIHPAFSADEERLHKAAEFVEREFLPRVKAMALCESGVICRDASDRMTFVDAHQAAFRDHGYCVRADSDPEFDRACFSPKGDSFPKSRVEGAERPLACGRSVKEFRPYASRARWVRTPNDSYFTAMTYPYGLSALMQPVDIHDALWGVVSAVYGGAVHPTAEGHAAMADAALPALREVLHIGMAPDAVEVAPLPAPAGGAPGRE